MGKKSRVKAAHQLEKENLQAKLAEQKKESKKNRKITATVTVAIVLALVIIFGATTAVLNSGVFLRGTVSLSTDHIEVDNAMLSYFFYNNFYNYLNSNSATAEQTGLNTTMSLKTQNYSNSLTWFDYIMDRTVNELSSYLVLAEAATVEGITLDEEDQAEIDAILETLANNAKTNGVSLEKYIYANYGRGVKEADIRRAMEIAFLADKKNEALVDSISFTSEEIAAYFEEHKEDFTYVDYRMFELSAQDYFAEDSIPEDANATIAALAAQMGAVKTEEQFDAKIKEYLTEAYKNKGEELTEETVNAALDNSVTTDAPNYDDAFSKWAFDSARKAGDVTVLSEEDGDVYTVYLLTNTAHKLDYTTKNVRHILIATSNYENDDAAKAEAEKILAEWNAGEKTEAAFEALAKDHNEDSTSLYENVSKNFGLQEFEDWTFDSARKAGDVEIVKTYYGYHIMYFIGDGMVAWEAEVENVMINEKYDSSITSYEETYIITYNQSKYNGVPGKNPSL